VRLHPDRLKEVKSSILEDGRGQKLLAVRRSAVAGQDMATRRELASWGGGRKMEEKGSFSVTFPRKKEEVTSARWPHKKTLETTRKEERYLTTQRMALRGRLEGGQAHPTITKLHTTSGT